MGAEVATMLGSSAVFALGLAMRLMVRRRGTGVGEVLLELVRGRAAAMSERERRVTTVEILERLPHGGRVDEVDESGRVDEVDESGRQRSYQVAPVPQRPGRDGGRR